MDKSTISPEKRFNFLVDDIEELSAQAGKLDTLIALCGDHPSEIGHNLSSEELDFIKWVLRDCSREIYSKLKDLLNNAFDFRRSFFKGLISEESSLIERGGND